MAGERTTVVTCIKKKKKKSEHLFGARIKSFHLINRKQVFCNFSFKKIKSFVKNFQETLKIHIFFEVQIKTTCRILSLGLLIIWSAEYTNIQPRFFYHKKNKGSLCPDEIFCTAISSVENEVGGNFSLTQ